MRALVAMSGGVDSSVAAAIMKRDGHEVIGVTLKLWQGPHGEAPTTGCCTVADSEDARRVAAALDIPYYVLDYTDDFRAGVVDQFINAYLRGKTPNPCVECNRSVKFSQLLAHSRELGCDLLVTGHYARVDRQGERRRLLRGVDRAKDQSYVLYMLGQEELARVRFPVGELRKAETRRIAADLGLRTAHKAESQDICFVGGGDYRGFLRREAPEALAPGPIADLSGRRVGSHQGIASFTIGQRRGLGVAVGEARFVVGIEPGTATVTIGRREDLLVEGMEVEGLTWVAGHPPPDGAITVKVRYHSDPVAADITGSAVRFDRPQGSVSPGQAAVFYQGDELLGGGTIARTYRVGRGL